MRIPRWISGLLEPLLRRAVPPQGSWSAEDIKEIPVSSNTSSDTDPRYATWDDAFELAAKLEQHGVDYVYTGGYALNFNGIVRQTKDLDIVVKDTPENNRRWTKALGEFLPEVKGDLEENAASPFHIETHDDGTREAAPLRIVDRIVIDVMPSACGMSYDDLEQHSHRIKTALGPIRVLDLEGLLLTKQGIRSKDIADKENIIIVMREIGMSAKELIEAQSFRSFGQEVQPQHAKGATFVHPNAGGREMLDD